MKSNYEEMGYPPGPFNGKYLSELPKPISILIIVLMGAAPGFIAGFLCMWLRSKGII